MNIMNNKKNPSINFDDFIRYVSAYNEAAVKNVIRAYKFAESKHLGQKRESGEDYISHPLNVAYILAEMHADENTLCAALLHDTIEDTSATYEELCAYFNETVANLVDGVTKLSKGLFDNDKSKASRANMRRIIMSLNDDVRILAIKLADRLHNMRTLEYKMPEKQVKISNETLDYYVPMALFMGTYDIKCELEDLSLKYINPNMYNFINKQRIDTFSEKGGIISQTWAQITEALNKAGIVADVKFQPKNIYGIYRKMQEHENFSGIHDVLAIKICVKTKDDCYAVRRIIEELDDITTMDSKYKNYITKPKSNGYQSIHTTVIVKPSTVIQIQIRTHDMDKVDSMGLMAYWDFSKGQAYNAMRDSLCKQFYFLNMLNIINNTYKDDDEFLEHVRKELFGENVYVFDVNGIRHELPKGATAIDFAYLLGEDYGNHLASVIINDEYEDFDTQLHTNDRIIVIKDENVKGPDVDWQSKAVTTRARRLISDYYSKE